MGWFKKSEKKKENIKMSNDNESMGGQSAWMKKWLKFSAD